MSGMREPYDRFQWALCVGFAVLPLVLFLIVLWVFSGSDPRVETVLSSVKPVPKALFAYAGARVGVVVLNYGTYVFAHTILCLGVIAYFVAVMRNRARTAGVGLRFQFGFAAVYAAVVCLAVILMTTNQPFPGLASVSVFSGLFVEPLRDLLQTLKMDNAFARYPGGIVTFLYLSLLVPTLLGVVAVVAGTAAFHHIVLSRPRRDSPDWQESFVDCVTVLKRQLTLLSLILISAVLTSRAYVNFMPSLVDPKQGEAHAIYVELASALSFSSGILFTATLFAAFAPGVVLLVMDVAGIQLEGKEHGLHAVLERLKINNPSSQIAAVTRVVLTLVAPALAGPVMNILTTAVG